MDPGDSDSEHVVDASMSSEIPDLSARADDLTTDTKESEDLSNVAGVLSAIPQRIQEDQQTDHNSLNEFEEFERLIQQNTAVDSDEEDTNDISEKESKSASSHSQTHHHDTGYQTGRFDNDRASHSSWRSRGHSDDEENEEEPEEEQLDSVSVTYQNDQQSLHSPRTSSRRSSMRSNHSRNLSGTHDQSTLNNSHSDLDVTLDRYLAPASPGTAEKDEDTDEKLVATFGTTEKFQELLEQQLHNNGEEEDDANSEENDSPHRNESRTLKLEGSIGKYGRKKPSERLKRKSLNRSTRSPAANRVKRAQRSGVSRASSNSSLHRDSSDETSVRSDVSRGELKRRLKKESKNRKKENEVVKELQTNYDDLLTRYAEAENVIDQLRLGAKIDLFASIPNAGSSGDIVRPASSNVDLSDAGPRSLNKDPSKDWEGASVGSENMDPLTESSLQLPFRASVEILRNELRMKVNDLKEQIDSFRTLLDEGDLSDVEKHQALRNIEEAARNLDRDYLQAIRDHDAERRRSLVYGRGAQSDDVNEEFDPQNKIKGELFNVRRMVDEVKDAVAFRGSVPQTPVSGTRSRSSVYDRKLSESSEDEDVDGNFSELLKRYTGSYPPPDNDEAHTTAPSGVLSTDEESDSHFDSSVADSTTGKARSSALPERYFQPPITAPPQSSPDTSPQSKERKSTRSMTPNRASSQTPKSRLPRFVGAPGTTGRSPDPPKKSQTGHEFEADSGFMGSESSRHSAATGSMISDPKSQNHQHRLMQPTPNPRVVQRQTRPTSTPAQKKPMLETNRIPQQKPQLKQRPSMSPMRPIHPLHSSPQHSESRNKQRSNRSPMTPTSNMSENNKHQNESYDDSDDLSATSTVKGLLNPIPRQAPNPGRSGSPKASHRQRQERAKSAGSEKSRASSRRSLGSSSRDSTLDMLRGEIAKLRAEIRESRNTEQETQTPTRVRDEKRDSSPERDRTNQGNSDRGRTTTRRKFEEDAPRKYDPENSENPHLRSSSMNRINDENQRPSTPTSHSHPQFSTSGGHWAYISPVGMHYPTVSPVPPPPVYYSTPQHLVPAPRVNTVYLTPPSMSTGRVYVPVQPSVQLAYPTPRVIRTPSTKGRKLRRASLYVVDSDSEEEDVPLSRSQLSPVKLRRSSSLSRISYRPVDTQLNLSLHRVEKASDDLRTKSMGMYRSLRDSLYKAEIMAGTM